MHRAPLKVGERLVVSLGAGVRRASSHVRVSVRPVELNRVLVSRNCLGRPTCFGMRDSACDAARSPQLILIAAHLYVASDMRLHGLRRRW